MTKYKKLLLKAINNPKGLAFEAFCTLMNHSGWFLDRQNGSHMIWFSPTRFRLPIQNHHGKAKEYQVRQFLEQYQKEVGNDIT